MQELRRGFILDLQLCGSVLMKALFLSVSDLITLINVENEDILEILGGETESHPIGDNGDLFFVHGSGKLIDLPHNCIATSICKKYKAICPDDFICGNMIIVGKDKDISDKMKELLSYRI